MGNGMNKVLPGLYIGNFRDSKDPDQLKEHNITHILSIHDNARRLPCNKDKEYLCIAASDTPGQNLMQYFPVCNDFIHAARLNGGAVLIHCLAGMSRSVTVAVVYVMCVTSLTWRDALKAVRGARNVANPNVGFLKQLQDFENERLADERRRLASKFPNSPLGVEDEQMAKDLLASYYHSISIGEMCDGNCPAGSTCPRGLCHSSKGASLFKKISKENSRSRPSSPSRQNSNSSRPSSPSSSPSSRSSPTPPSPLTSRSEIIVVPITTRSLSSLDRPYYGNVYARTRQINLQNYDRPSSPNSSPRSYRYYTSSPVFSNKTATPFHSPKKTKTEQAQSSGESSAKRVSDKKQELSTALKRDLSTLATPPNSPFKSNKKILVKNSLKSESCTKNLESLARTLRTPPASPLHKRKFATPQHTPCTPPHTPSSGRSSGMSSPLLSPSRIYKRVVSFIQSSRSSSPLSSKGSSPRTVSPMPSTASTSSVEEGDSPAKYVNPGNWGAFMPENVSLLDYTDKSQDIYTIMMNEHSILFPKCTSIANTVDIEQILKQTQSLNLTPDKNVAENNGNSKKDDEYIRIFNSFSPIPETSPPTSPPVAIKSSKSSSRSESPSTKLTPPSTPRRKLSAPATVFPASSSYASFSAQRDLKEFGTAKQCSSKAIRVRSWETETPKKVSSTLIGRSAGDIYEKMNVQKTSSLDRERTSRNLPSPVRQHKFRSLHTSRSSIAEESPSGGCGQRKLPEKHSSLKSSMNTNAATSKSYHIAIKSKEADNANKHKVQRQGCRDISSATSKINSSEKKISIFSAEDGRKTIGDIKGDIAEKHNRKINSIDKDICFKSKIQLT